jgi:hypothetical protein
MAQLFSPPPIQIDEVTIEDLRIAAVGAEATATGYHDVRLDRLSDHSGIARPRALLR